MQEVTIRQRDSFCHSVLIDRPGQELCWNFRTVRHTVAFGLFKRADNPGSRRLVSGDPHGNYLLDSTIATSALPTSPQSPTSPSRNLFKQSSFTATQQLPDPPRPRTPKRTNGWPDPDLHELLPVRSYESSRYTIRGTFQVNEPGTYVLMFDNSFSINTSKKLFFSVALRDLSRVEPTAADVKVLQGWILKKGNKKLQGYGKRWIKLQNDGMLSYSKRPGGFPHGHADLARCATRLDHDHLLIDIDSGSSLFHFKAQSINDFTSLVAAMQPYLSTLSSFHRESLALTSSEPLSANEALNGSSYGLADPTVDQWRSRVNLYIDDMTTHFKTLELLVSKLASKDAPPNLSTAFRTTEDGLATLKRDVATILDQYQRTQNHTMQLEVALQSAFKENNVLQETIALSRVDEYGIHGPVPSFRDDEFFDAEENQTIDQKSDSDDNDKHQFVEEDDDDESGENDDNDGKFLPTFASIGLAGSSDKPGHHRQQNEVIHRRKALPAPAVSLANVSAFSILKNNVGKDLSAISMPVAFNEPLNLLQHMAEELEYSDLVDRACSTLNPVDRIILITAFAVSAAAHSVNRARRKPFNPLLGETYECTRPDKGFKFVSEKVCQSSPIMACHAESPKYEYSQNSLIRTKFWGKSVELINHGNISLWLKDFDERYTWGKPTSCIRNVFSSSGRYTEHYGSTVVRNHKTGHSVDLKFKEANMFGVGQNEIVGNVHDPSGRLVSCIGGRWDDNVYKYDPTTPNVVEIIWKINPFPRDSATYYGFTQFAIELNELTPDLIGQLPTSDTRYRPDQRLFEQGRVAEADAEKERLENKQRVWRKNMVANEEVYKPQWFEGVDDGSGDIVWKFNGRYWMKRGNFAPTRDLW
ncbi:hypothetical protein SeMB42_g01117 [Synchytrium endobioticum]|uniref:GOLD domain-containing protein n=1 Tax=Synchytrium endobioticum TaxID=286115 RepID=A0A507DCV5_9FUNG|nr:hypothetical protein SeLEV6574_g01885 [Synchytrium endobioticum]TPX52888.1 hypothetical protein SeMB42_g01117 [Synchytrium endobioticum]